MRYVDIDRIDDYLSGDLSAAARAEIKEAVEIMPAFQCRSHWVIY